MKTEAEIRKTIDGLKANQGGAKLMPKEQKEAVIQLLEWVLN